jgi:hypothetical protein
MNRNILFVLVMSGFSAGCASMGSMDNMSPMEGTACTVLSIDSDCSGDKNFPIVTLNTQDATLDVHPTNVCVNKQSEIIFRVVPPGHNDVGTVSITAKKSADTWLNGANSPDEKEIKILVPEWVGTNENYDYNIQLSDGRCVDPRVHVEN